LNIDFSYKWFLKDLEKVKPNGLKVFTCFSGAGGSSMGYKMNGHDVIGCLEIDKRAMEIYQGNLKPKFPFLDSIQEFKKRSPNGLDFPEELYDLDILDGSPPCSVFSTAGRREEKWGAEFKFREGQVTQRLDDLFFDFIDLAGKLRPKVIVAENVLGMLKGGAKGITKEIIEAFKKIGYVLQLFKLNGAVMGLPQKRYRVFFIAHKVELFFPKLELHFNERLIPFREIRDDTKGGKPLHASLLKLWEYRKFNDVGFDQICFRVLGKKNFFNYKINHNDKVSYTIPARTGGATVSIYDSPRFINLYEATLASSFPLDFKFKNDREGFYSLGMSVPPLMVYKISREIAKQWFKL
jgi:DNA (cytosine-5)-methyltransferase 1